jgi:mono/diheme cytochrome c family protein
VEEIGKNVYNTKCMMCHGDDGKLGLSGAKDLTTSAMTRDEKIALVQNGKNSMMPFKDQLTQEQIDAVVTYVESLGK